MKDMQKTWIDDLNSDFSETKNTSVSRDSRDRTDSCDSGRCKITMVMRLDQLSLSKLW